MEWNSVIKKEYVITPCQNSFNNKISFWISKKGYTVSFYCFSLYPFEDNEYNKFIKDVDRFNSYISLYENALRRLNDEKSGSEYGNNKG